MDLSTTITAGGTAQILAAFDPRRISLSIQPEADLWVSFGGTADDDSPSYFIGAGESAVWGRDFREMLVRPISIYGATTGDYVTASAGLS